MKTFVLEIENPFEAAAFEVIKGRDDGKSVLAALAKRIFFAGEVKRTSPAPKGWVRVKDIAEMLDVNEKTIYELTAKGELPHHKIGGAIRFSPDDVAAATARGNVAI